MELRMSFTGREPSPRCEALNSIPKPQGEKKGNELHFLWKHPEFHL